MSEYEENVISDTSVGSAFGRAVVAETTDGVVATVGGAVGIIEGVITDGLAFAGTGVAKVGAGPGSEGTV